MPDMANITVKDRANADVVYNKASASSGDRSPAVWRANALSAKIGHRPSFTCTTRDNAKKNGRVIEGTYKYPIVDSVSGDLIATVPLSFSGTLPTNVSAVQVADAFVQFGNLLVSTLVRSVAEEGYAPT